MAAARAMLDEVHEDLPRHRNDSNTYTLGSIEHHNIVIACLPTAQYGTNNAANVLTHLSIVGDGQIQPTAIPKIPQQLLGTVVSTLRSKHELEPSRVPSILREKFEGHSEYGRPSSPDYLFCATYDHASPTPGCDGCDQSKLVPRSGRLTDDPLIHYGAIASGNQVMRSGTVRDNIARRVDVICFEMEAAGLMDILPCLPIRGICDYSDSHKNKEWQRYAAAAAAAYAGNYWRCYPWPKRVQKLPTCPSLVNRDLSNDHRQRLLDSLRFEHMDSRKSTIKTAHAKTCRWFLNHPDYQAWLDAGKLTQHHGFLWISGKPGAGKSTIMKFAYSSMKSKARRKHSITASFFFNARGEYLERSIVGMYRSLLLQLLEGYPDLQTVLDDPDLVSPSQNGCPCLNVLKDLFCNAVSALGQRSFTCFIDALDECDEQQVMDMVQYFEDLAEQSTDNRIALRICFSSRHYPYIIIRRGIRLTLEDQPGHAEDLANYVASRLRIKEPALVEELQPQLLGKAAGVFLWIVLVVDILNNDYGRGGLALRKRLAEIPSGLSELFKDILRRDNENMEDLLLCILWILYAKQPLRPTEFYHALWSGLSLKEAKSNGQTEISKYPFLEYASQHVLHHANAAANAVPQDEFLSHFPVPNWISIINLFEKFKVREYSPGASLFYLLAEKGFSELIRTRLKEDPRIHCFGERYGYPLFAALANGNKDAVAALLNSPSSICNGVDITEGLNCRKDLKDYKSRTPLSWAAQDGRAGIVKLLLQTGTTFNEDGWTLLLRALKNGHEVVARVLIEKGADVNASDKDGWTPLLRASEKGDKAVAGLLIEKGADVNASDKDRWTPLLRASEKGHEAVAGLLIKKGADVNVSDKDGWTPLWWASKNGHEAVAELLIDKGADINASDKDGWTPLLRASEKGDKAVAGLLIKKGADVNVSDKDGWTPLWWASKNGHEAVAELLIDKGADINASDKDGWTPLLRASEKGDKAVAGLLIKKGADVNVSDKDGWTPLWWASKNGHEAVAELLIDKGVDVNASDNFGLTPLSWASNNGYEAVAELLIDKGADVNARNNFGSIPLLEASNNGHEAVARLLIDKGADGADVNASDKDGWTLLSWASKNGHEVVARVLIEKGADVNASDYDGWTPLSWASKNGHEVVARVLIEKGADVNASDYDGWTPLSWASKNGHEVVARVLIEKGADVNASDQDGWTPLLRALKNGHEVVARVLIEKGADVNASDKDGSTPILWALEKGHEAVARVLIEKGADSA
ncbi:ankyrin repeat-containing domain protein [Dactylonectria estremocensis]|uniref:Ankyrin repeat-containing domain protein n=1 Tax=Dactylonectria estremocensis TaxID=1079267 RepID=A0A9P9DVV8_9HYPO|nr:ankyrin repeat-containing domain protein [Dactylonectria estremocensis]